MPSLDKIKPDDKSFVKWFASHSGPYVCMDKLDGISVQLYKDEHGQVDLFTKKQTNMGTSKKYMLEYLVDRKILDRIPSNTSVRGEVVISNANFAKLQKLELGYKNPRSAMAGLMNTDKLDRRIAKMAEFVVYGILSPRYTLADQLRKLSNWGFGVVWHTVIRTQTDTMQDQLHQMLETRKATSPYLIDGIVVADDSTTYPHTPDNPKHAMAFKTNSQNTMKNATVVRVIWEPTMYGYLQPVVQIEPIVLEGAVTVTYVTAHNARYIEDNRIGVGTVIRIVRSGDVIPYIVEVIRPTEPAMPAIKYMWNDTNVEIIAVDPPADILAQIRIKQTMHFFKKIGVKYLSQGIVTKLYATGYVDALDIIKQATAQNKDLYLIGGLGEKMVTKIYNQIDTALARVGLAELMGGSLCFGRGIGVRKIKEILAVYPEILGWAHDTRDQIMGKVLGVNGFSDNLAGKFAERFAEFYQWYQRLQSVTNVGFSFDQKPSKPSNKASSKPRKPCDQMAGQKVVMSGFRSQTISDWIEQNGGKVASSVSKKTTMVLCTDEMADPMSNSSKVQKARELGILVIGRSEFERKYNITA
jgi:NAD-dependent DNA ligase